LGHYWPLSSLLQGGTMKFYKIKEAIEDYMHSQGKDSPDLWMATMSLLNAANYFSQKAPKDFKISDEKLTEMISEMVDLWNPDVAKISAATALSGANDDTLSATEFYDKYIEKGEEDDSV
jgi:hypothetical protein